MTYSAPHPSNRPGSPQTTLVLSFPADLSMSPDATLPPIISFLPEAMWFYCPLRSFVKENVFRLVENLEFRKYAWRAVQRQRGRKHALPAPNLSFSPASEL